MELSQPTDGHNKPKIDNVTGIILAGGVSKRLGYRDKALLELGGVSIIERVISALSRAVKDILLITNSPEKYAHLDLPMFGDIIPGAGSLGGIYTGIGRATEKNARSTTRRDCTGIGDTPGWESTTAK